MGWPELCLGGRDGVGWSVICLADVILPWQALVPLHPNKGFGAAPGGGKGFARVGQGGAGIAKQMAKARQVPRY